MDSKGYGEHGGRRAIEQANAGIKETFSEPPEPLKNQNWPPGWCIPCADRGRYHWAEECQEA